MYQANSFRLPSAATSPNGGGLESGALHFPVLPPCPQSGRFTEAVRLVLHARASGCFMRLWRASFSRPPPDGGKREPRWAEPRRSEQKRKQKRSRTGGRSFLVLLLSGKEDIDLEMLSATRAGHGMTAVLTRQAEHRPAFAATAENMGAAVFETVAQQPPFGGHSGAEAQQPCIFLLPPRDVAGHTAQENDHVEQSRYAVEAPVDNGHAHEKQVDDHQRDGRPQQYPVEPVPPVPSHKKAIHPLTKTYRFSLLRQSRRNTGPSRLR